MNPLDKFGDFIIKNLRDKAIEQNEMLIAGKLKGMKIKELQDRVSRLSSGQRDVVREVVRDVLDTTLHDLLFAIQEAHELSLGLEISVDGINIAEESGMLNGEPLGRMVG